MPYAQIEVGVPLYYELTGPEDAPIVLQFGGGLFGRHNFGLVNDGFRERFRLLAFDARGYGASDHPREAYTIEGWAGDGAGLLDAARQDVGDERERHARRVPRHRPRRPRRNPQDAIRIVTEFFEKALVPA